MFDAPSVCPGVCEHVSLCVLCVPGYTACVRTRVRCGVCTAFVCICTHVYLGMYEQLISACLHMNVLTACIYMHVCV